MARKSKPWWWSERSCWATTIDGKRERAPADVVTEHDAWAWHADLKRERAPKPASRSTTTVRDVLEAYAAWDDDAARAGERNPSTTQNDLSAIQTILKTRIGGAAFGSLLAAHLTPDHYDALLVAWRRFGYKPNTVASLARKIKTMMLWASRPTLDRRPFMEASPFKACKVPPTPASVERYGDRSTAARWLWFLWGKNGGKRMRDDALFQRCLIHTGARPSELGWATWGEVKWDAMRDSAGHPMAVVMRKEWKNSKKTGKVRRIFLPSRLVRAMRRRMEGRGADELIFPTVRGKRHHRQSLADRTRDLRTKAAESGVVLVERNGAGITNYVWRHTAASNLLMSGVDTATVAELLGTSAAQIQRTYGHLLADHLALASEKLGRRR